jgi:predicted 2-oxoglutarate/Fe(II)-dependent dioxygenase YbiX
LATYRSLEPEKHPSLPNPLARVHLSHCWSPEICRWLVAQADAYGGWATDRHASVPTTDLEVLRVPALRDWLLRESRQVLFPTLAQLYGFEPAHLRYMDLFLVRYTAERGDAGQRGLQSHRDRSLLSFNIALSAPGSFDGGGTRIDALGPEPVRPTAQGDLVTHSGKLRHTGVPVTRGTRDVLVGFVAVDSPDVDQGFVRSLYAKLNVESVERDLDIVSRALRVRQPPAEATESDS